MTIYGASQDNAVDQRVMVVRVGIDTDVYEFNQELNMTCQTRKTALSVQDTATIVLTNLTLDMRALLFKFFTQWQSRNRKQPFIPVDVRIGRASQLEEKWITVFMGAILESSVGNPPDMDTTIKCSTSLIDMNLASTGFITRAIPKVQTFKGLCEWAAGLGNLQLQYEVTTPLGSLSANVAAGVIQKAYSLTAIVGLLANFYKNQITVFIDNGVLVVTEWSKALRGSLVEVNAGTWLIGIPTITQWGVKFTTLADAPIRIAGAVALFSEINTSVNQQWVVTGVEYNISSRDNAWYATWTASPAAAE